MSDYVNSDKQFALFNADGGFGAIDWNAELQGILQEPWLDTLDFFDWEAYAPHAQGTTAMLPEHKEHSDADNVEAATAAPDQPFEDLIQIMPNHQCSPVRLGQKDRKPVKSKPAIVCTVEGCRAKPFKRRAEMQRHQRQKHSTLPPQYPCAAVDCNRIGDRAFYREDKRNDHVLSGHETETLFKCTKLGCSKILTRDLIALHNGSGTGISNRTRKCPMPRCSFNVNLKSRKSCMDDMLVHLQEKHDLKGRLNHRTLLSAGGYDARTGAIVCPMCSAPDANFEKHAAFRRHLLTVHLHYTQPGDALHFIRLEAAWVPAEWHSDDSLSKIHVPEEIRQHRRVILSLWPRFQSFSVCDDIVSCQA